MKKLPWLLPVPLLFLPLLDAHHSGLQILYSAMLTVPMMIALFLFTRRGDLSSQVAPSYWIQIKHGWRKLLATVNSENQHKNLFVAFVVTEVFLLLVAPALGISVLLLSGHFILADA